MSINDDIRVIVREEIRAALAELRGAGVGIAEPEPDLVPLAEVRRWVRVSKSTLKEWIRRGELAKYGKGRIVRVKLNDVRQVLEGRGAAARPSTSVASASAVQRILASVPGGRR